MFHRLTSDVLAVVALAIGASCVLTALAKLVADRIGLIDTPDGSRKSHTEPTPLMGGVAIFGSLLITLFVARWAELKWLVDNPGRLEFTSMLLVSSGLFCLLGLWDDKWGIRPRTKFLLQIVACLPFVMWGRSIDSVHFLGIDVVLGPFGALFTVFWLVGCVNIINLVDGLDGLAGSIGLIICLAVAAHSEMQGLVGVAPLGLIVAGSLFGFLLHNWPPATIFLGDSGSLTVGFLVGALSIEGSLKTATGFALAVPLVLISVPVFDTVMAILRRKLTGRGIGEADRAHIHHCLQNRGLTRWQSLLAITALCMAMAGAALFSAYFQNDVLALSVCVGLLAMLIVGRVFGYNETVLIFRHIQVISTFFIDTSSLLRTRFLLARFNHEQTDRSNDYWSELTERVRQLGGSRLEFACRNQLSDTVVCQRTWSSDEPVADGAAVWEIHYERPREGNVLATLSASGSSLVQGNPQPLVELFQVFDAMCQIWPIEEHTQPEPDDVLESAVDPEISSQPNFAAIFPLREPADENTKDRRAA